MPPPATLRIVSFLLLAMVVSVARAAEPDPLFQSNEVLTISITAPFTTLMRERPDEEELPGTASWTEADGRQVEVGVELRTRGNYRRDASTCPFAPLRLDFRGSEVDGTLFDGQDKLKLVTHCRERSSRYEQLVLREYLTYRMLNAITDISYRVRLLRITYRDTEGRRDDRETWAFLIEHKDRFARRTGLEPLEIDGTTIHALDPAYTNLTSIFHYMIGNTDFSPISAPEGTACCHNTHPFSAENGPIHSVPYDFDMSGMIDAPYAAPNPRFRLRDVRHRLYRGRCRFNEHVAASVARYQEVRDALYAIVADEPNLSSTTRRSMNSFLNSFYRTIDDPRSVERRLTGACI